MAGGAGTFREALQTILNEVFEGPPSEWCFLLNPGDPGLLGTLESIDATAASTRPMAGTTTIAAHAHHLHFCMALLNRWAAGEEDPWSGADWAESWTHTQVDEGEWRALLAELRGAWERWKEAVATRSDWDATSAAGAISSAAHTTYHFGAIRQILAAQSPSRP